MLRSFSLFPGATLVKYPALNNYDKKGKNKNISYSRYVARSTNIIFGRSNSKFNLNLESRRSLCCKCQLSDVAPETSAAYGLLLLSGGLFAFNKSRSKGSLFGGLSGAALMTTAYFLMQSQETKTIGDALGFGSTFLFSSVFGIRLAATRKLIPAGPLLGLSICALAVFILAYLQDSP